MQKHDHSRDTHAHKHSNFSGRNTPAHLLKGSLLLVHCLLWC